MSVLRQNQNQGNEEEIYFNFINSIKSEVTKKIYERDIKSFMKFCEVTKLTELLAIIEPQKQIIKYLMSLREKGLSFNSIATELNDIYHFYDMNDVTLNRKKINMFKGEFERKVIDRAIHMKRLKKY